MRRTLLLLVSAGTLACSGGGSNSDNSTTQPPASAPAISLSSNAAVFAGTAGAASPAAQAVTVTNSGTGTLSGLAVGTIAYAGGPSGGWLSASLSAATAPATMTLTPATSSLVAGTYTATVPITSSASGVTNNPQSVSLTLTVGPGTATHLIFGTPPAPTAGGAITPAVTVSIEDALGDVVTTATTSITIALGANSAGATLSGTTTAAAVAGVATFSGLSLSKAGSGFTFVASAAGLTGATSSAFTVAAAVSASLSLSTGQSSAFLSSPNFSTTLAVQPGAQYLVAVVNTDATYVITEGFSFTGSFSASSAAASALRTAGAPARQAAQPAASQGPLFDIGAREGPSVAALSGALRSHSAVLEQDGQIYANFGNPGAAWARARSQGARQATVSASISQSVGTVSKVYVLNQLAGNCTTVDSIGARTVAVGQHVIVLADTSLAKWPQAYRPDTSFYQSFANEYDQVTWPHLLANIGNPLAYDAQLSGTGKVTVTLTPVLNNFKGPTGGGMIVAFVNSCDYYPYQASGNNADFSNQTEMFYSLVPSATGYSVAGWEAELRATAAHETKHIISFSQRFLHSSPFEQIWLEEGLAQESSEIWERNYNSATWKGNADFFATVACELSLGSGAPCSNANTNGTLGKPYALVGSHLPFFFQYLQAESSSNSEGLGFDTPANYGAGWTISRWATDQYASAGEGAFIQSLINEPTQTGLNNLALHTGQSVATLLVYWNVATAIFQGQTYTASDARITIPSFNFASIDSIGQRGLSCLINGVRQACGIFATPANSLTPTFPVTPAAVSATGTFSKVVNSVPGTAASFFLLSAPNAGVETLQLLTPAGASLLSSSGLRVAIVRVQ
jgi:hypothetical protein